MQYIESCSWHGCSNIDKVADDFHRKMRRDVDNAAAGFDKCKNVSERHDKEKNVLTEQILSRNGNRWESWSSVQSTSWIYDAVTSTFQRHITVAGLGCSWGFAAYGHYRCLYVWQSSDSNNIHVSAMLYDDEKEFALAYSLNCFTTGWMCVCTIQPVVKPVGKPVWQPLWPPVGCLFTRYGRLSNLLTGYSKYLMLVLHLDLCSNAAYQNYRIRHQ